MGDGQTFGNDTAAQEERLKRVGGGGVPQVCISLYDWFATWFFLLAVWILLAGGDAGPAQAGANVVLYLLVSGPRLLISLSHVANGRTGGRAGAGAGPQQARKDARSRAVRRRACARGKSRPWGGGRLEDPGAARDAAPRRALFHLIRPAPRPTQGRRRHAAAARRPPVEPAVARAAAPERGRRQVLVLIFSFVVCLLAKLVWIKAQARAAAPPAPPLHTPFRERM